MCFKLVDLVKFARNPAFVFRSYGVSRPCCTIARTNNSRLLLMVCAPSIYPRYRRGDRDPRTGVAFRPIRGVSHAKEILQARNNPWLFATLIVNFCLTPVPYLRFRSVGYRASCTVMPPTHALAKTSIKTFEFAATSNVSVT